MAIGLLQMLSLGHAVDVSKIRYQRTPPKNLPSEAIADFLRKNIFRLLSNASNLTISHKIIALMSSLDGVYEKIEAS
jgi:hypothetical protein